MDQSPTHILSLFRQFKSIFVLSVFIVAFFFQVSSQQIQHLGVAEGLSGSQTFNIVQDRKGFIWIATRFGVNRYDGEEVKHYPMSILYNGTNPFRRTHVILDRDSNLWAYTDRGTIYRYDEKRDEFTFYNDVKRYLKKIYFDKNNNIWGGANSYITVITSSEDSVELIRDPLLQTFDIRDIVEYDDNNVLLVTTRSILTLNTETRKIELLVDIDKLTEKEVKAETCHYLKDSDEIWIGSSDNGLYIYNLKKAELNHIANSHLYHHPILDIVNYDDTFLLLGTDGVGMCMLNKKTYTIEHFYNQWSPRESRIAGDAVYDIFIDKENRIWLSTYSNGVNIIDFKETTFRFLSYEENNLASLSSDVVCNILEDSDKNLWFATDKGLNYWNRTSNKWKTFLESKNVITIYEDSHKNIWASVYSSGIYVINKNGQLIHHFTHQDKNDATIGTNIVYSIEDDAEGNLWIGGKRGNVTKYNPTHKTFSHIPIDEVNYITRKGNDKMLISSDYGVYLVSVKTDKVEACAFNKHLRSHFVSDMYVESDSIVWLATYGDGINRCNFYTGEITRFTQHDDGIGSNIIHSLSVDEHNNLWFASENGLGKINLTNFSVVHLPKSEVMINRFRRLSREKCLDGSLFFGSHEGAVYFYPQDIQYGSSRGKLSFQEFSLFNQVVKPGDKDSPLVSVLDNTSEITLNYKQHSFSINFTAVDFTAKNRRYIWILEGLDNDWTQPTSEHIANYTNLSPGKYVFKVKYLDENQQTLDERQISIHVKPPFWETTWARIIEILLIVGILYATYLYIRQQYRKKQSEEKIRFFISTAHDIRTPLTLINSPIYQLKEEVEASDKTNYLFGLVTDNLTKLNKMFSQLLDFQKSYELKDQLVVREQSVKQYLEEKVVNWKLLAQKKDITFNLETPKEDIVEWFDIKKMDRILDNLVSNAVKYTPNNGTITVKLTNESNYWEISVTDNGIGISKQEKEHLFHRFYRASNAINSQETGSGLGLLLVKQYVTLHKGKVGMSSIENKGSVFYVQFRHGKEHYQDNVKLDNDDIPILDDMQEAEDEQQTVDKLKIKLLVVEDNNDLRRYLRNALSSYYQVFTTVDGAEAWEKIPQINPDIIVTDYQMPNMNGFELCEKIKKNFTTSHIPVIILTVVSDKQYVEKGYGIGADDYIEKPFDIKYLRLKIDNIIQNRKIIRQKFLGLDGVEIEKTENKLNDEFINKATEIINANISNSQFSIADFSKEMGLSRSLLFTKFSSITGYTPNEFIKVIRLNKAIQYFKEKRYSINEISYMVGFEDSTYFSKTFKKIYGKSPKQFIEDNIS